MSTPLVSVVIPTYNRASVITRTIENVFAQTYSNLEVIVVDDGSTDDTQAKLRGFHDRIGVITQSNAGPSIARNRGARFSKGEFIAFQDSDDLWEPTKIARQVALLTKYGAKVACCICNARMSLANGEEWTSFVDSSIRPQHREGLWLNVPEILATRFLLFNQTVVIRREAFERVGGFREDLRYLEDYDLPLRLSLEGPWAFIRDPLVLYQEGSPESFSQRALKEPIVLRECAVEIFASVLAKVTGQSGNTNLRRLLAHRLALLRLLLIGTKLKQTRCFATRAIGSLLIGLDHYMRAAFRRSPWFPRPVTSADERLGIN